VQATSASAAAEPPAPVAPALRTRGYWSLVWLRFRRDRAAVVALAVLAAIVFSCFAGESIASHFLGHGADDPFPYGADDQLTPVGPFSWVPDVPSTYPPPTAHTPHTLFVLGADGPVGRDELLRLLSGGQLSLEIAFEATLVAALIGITLGILSGYFGGWADTVVSAATEFAMAFPLLLLVIAVGQTIADRFDFITVGGLFEPGVLSLGVVIGLFMWFHPARIVRSLVFSLREREFVEAARMTGASNRRILVRHVLPHIAGPVLVWSTMVAASVIVLEAALSFLNFGIRLPAASWGSLLSANWGTLLSFSNQPPTSTTAWTMALPAACVFLTVLSLTLVGDGLRYALDSREESS
jgi:peptide/nickel transport system permease protein